MSRKIEIGDRVSLSLDSRYDLELYDFMLDKSPEFELIVKNVDYDLNMIWINNCPYGIKMDLVSEVIKPSDILEMDRVIYATKAGYSDENKIMLIKEEKDNKASWLAYKGWEYVLWYAIGERGGLAEAGELTILRNHQKTPISIEEYVALYKDLIEKEKNLDEIFDRFKISYSAWVNKDMSWGYIKDKLVDDFKLEKDYESDKRIYYKGFINNVDLLSAIWINEANDDYEIKVIFEEK